MKKCRYCGKELDSNLEFCSSECENSYRKIIEKGRHKIKYFISGIILGFLAMFYGVVSSRNCMIGSGIIVMGVTVVLLPFTTSETTALFGNKKARFIGRILGMIIDVIVSNDGKIKSLVLEDRKNRKFTREEFIVSWNQITKIGDDIILVDTNRGNVN